MKKLKSLAFRFVVYTTLLCMLFLSTALQSIASTNVKVYFNGKLMEFGTNSNDPPPYIKEGRTLIPFRRIFEALGMDVGWDPALRMVTAKGNDIEMTLYIGNKIAIVNGQEKELDVAAEITDGRTFVPLRFVSENCGAEVAWDDSTKSVYITLPENVPSSSGEPERKSLGEETTYEDLTFSFDEVVIKEVEGTNNNRIAIMGKTNLKNATLLLEVFDNYGNSKKQKPMLSHPNRNLMISGHHFICQKHLFLSIWL
ncbi:copper amine oxidase N-terminal domain-containing protein [Acetivibrio straminisolvens]|uniref:Copper amine oxidase-like protein n=1 Tax=Acetivibrio straminisolvens JCM 21531 TaxID=1294263 RepID=W4V530_9FIRM|nr:copper amine oxidase N-terminal domain-containing protein [Acetivibrio straminisolvens]GAE88535.1 copper amine oxidase-like protein [Acetivibrio straminisolvens JCM 21531]